MNLSVRLMITCTVFFSFVSESPSALRVRYSYCADFYSNAGEDCSCCKRKHEYREKVIPGIWDGYDAQSGFDNLADSNLGSFDSAPSVGASYWVDSVFEPSADRKNAALVSGYMSESDMRDPQLRAEMDGYIVYAAGHLFIPVAGEYEFHIRFDDGMIVWIDQNGDGEIGFDDTLDALNGTRDTVGFNWYKGIDGQPFARSATFAAPGLYKIMVWYWDWPGISWAELSWKVPGSGTVVPIPSGAFGKRRNFGLPAAKISRIEIGGRDVPANAWSFCEISGCTPVTFFATAENMLGAQPVFIWNFGDSTADTTTDSVITHRYFSPEPFTFFTPSLKVKRSSTISARNAETVLFTTDCTEPLSHSVARMPVAHKSIATWNRGVLSVKGTNHSSTRLALYTAAGQQVADLRGARGETLILNLHASRFASGVFLARITRAENTLTLPIVFWGDRTR